MFGRRQQGASLWGLLLVFIMVAFYVYLGFQIGPAYMNNWQIASALKGVATAPGADTMGRSQLREAVRQAFSVGYVSHVSVARDLHIEGTVGRSRVLVFRYNVHVPILYNVSALIHFTDRRKVPNS